MGAGYCNRYAAVHGPGLAMAAFAGTSPGGHSGRGRSSILAVGSGSDCSSRHAEAEDWAVLTGADLGGAAYTKSSLRGDARCDGAPRWRRAKNKIKAGRYSQHW